MTESPGGKAILFTVKPGASIQPCNGREKEVEKEENLT